MSMTSSQKFIARNRAPRVQIEYDVELYGAEKSIALPFVVGVFADLAGRPVTNPSSLEQRRMIEIDIDNFDDCLSNEKPRVAFSVPDTIGDNAELAIDITFESLDDFSPAGVARKVAGLDKLLEQRIQLANLVTYMDGKVGAESLVRQFLNDETLLNKVALNSRNTDDDGAIIFALQERDPVRDTQEPSKDSFTELLIKEFAPKSDRAIHQVEIAVKTLAEQALFCLDSFSGDAAKSIEAIIDQVDRKLTVQLNPILHHPDFQQLEGAWRGLHYLVNNTETDEILKIRFMNVSKKELGRVTRIYKGTAWEQSPLFKKVYEEQYGQFGGEPYGCLIGDYEFDNSPQDVEILSGMAQIAAAAHLPFIAAASPSAMQMDSWQEIANPRDITKIFSTPDYAAWRSLRESEDSRYLALAMPRFLARLPYGNDTDPVEEFDFQEDYHDGDPGYYTWCNSAYAMGVNITRAFKQYGWCAHIRGVDSGGAVEGLPVHLFLSDDGSIDTQSPTEVSISDRWEAELARNGFMPLLHKKNSDFAAFIGARSFHKSAEYDDPDITAHAAMTARLPYILASCRFAHYLKCIVRDRIGSFKDRASMEKWLDNWIKQYVDYDPARSSEESKARKPLADAQVVLEDIEGDLSHYILKLYIRPHYQLEGLTIPLRLVSKLPSEHLA